MAASYTIPVQVLIDQLGRMPGIGPKSAQRIAFHLLKLPAEDVERLAGAITDAKAKVRFCSQCFNFAEDVLCPICADPRRDPTVLCVVEESSDIIALERTGEFRGRYHVLLGVMNPIDGIGPEQLKIRELVMRLSSEEITEVIVCTNPNTEGEVTASYLGRLLKPFNIRVTRPASGLPVGGDLEYADELTLGRAINGRRTIDD
ncbi:MAG: recombination protein RecR [Ilumatobacteraceae bacterium]|nr:recombination protein RecR [Ilumatobacteraceae bacterium]MBJ7426918.1 recombination protein RecR [Ilumatobacteraceae bacterium]MBJ7507603.1 recombination protein RecR [Ilumatobacteraceae bacterium]